VGLKRGEIGEIRIFGIRTGFLSVHLENSAQSRPYS
jgi:hypothetical protein